MAGAHHAWAGQLRGETWALLAWLVTNQKPTRSETEEKLTYLMLEVLG